MKETENNGPERKKACMRGVCVYAIFVTFFLSSKKTRIFVLPASRKTWQKCVDR